MAPRVWTPQQQRIFQWMANGQGHLIIRARAGAGKTSTLHEGICRHVPRTQRVLVTAFNKHTATDVQSKIGSGFTNVVVKTAHALGYQILREKLGGLRVDARRTKTLTQQIMGRGKHVWAIAQFADRIKDGAPWAQSVEDIIDHGRRLDVLLEEKDMPLAEQAALVQRVLQASLQVSGEVAFSDQIFVPYRRGWTPLDQFDLVVVDELQDMAPAQIELALQSLSPEGRFVAAGDDRQMIYAWRGATVNGLDDIKEQLKAAELPLTVSFRCSKSVVAEARKVVGDIQALSTAIDGAIGMLKKSEMLNEISTLLSDPNNTLSVYVLSRFNAPLFPLALEFVGRRVPVLIQGKDYGQRMVDLVEKMGATTKPQLISKLDLWAKSRLRYISPESKDPEDKRARAEVEDFVKGIKLVAERASAVAEIPTMIRTLFEGGGSQSRQVTLSTVHRVKGFEADLVFVLADTLVTKNKRLLWRIDCDTSEKNIEYVAVTRAKAELWWVVPDDKEAEAEEVDFTGWDRGWWA